MQSYWRYPLKGQGLNPIALALRARTDSANYELGRDGAFGLDPGGTMVVGDAATYTDTLGTSGNRCLLKQFYVASPCTISSLYMGFATTSSAGVSYKSIVFSDNGSNAPGTLLAAGAGVAVPAGGGSIQSSFTPIDLTPGYYWFGGVTNDFQALFNHSTAGTGDGPNAIVSASGFSYASPPSTWPGTTSDFDYNVPVYANGVIPYSPEVEPGIGGNVTVGVSHAITISYDTYKPTPTTANFGRDTPDADTIPSSDARVWVSQFTMPEDGEVISISAYQMTGTAGGGSWWGVLFSDSGDSPSTRLAITTAKASVGANNWITESVITPVALTGGTKYWIGYYTSGFYNDMSMDNTAPGSFLVRGEGYAGGTSFPASPAVSTDVTACVYATYNVAGGSDPVVDIVTTHTTAITASVSHGGIRNPVTAQVVSTPIVKSKGGIGTAITAHSTATPVAAKKNGVSTPVVGHTHTTSAVGTKGAARAVVIPITTATPVTQRVKGALAASVIVAATAALPLAASTQRSGSVVVSHSVATPIVRSSQKSNAFTTVAVQSTPVAGVKGATRAVAVGHTSATSVAGAGDFGGTVVCTVASSVSASGAKKTSGAAVSPVSSAATLVAAKGAQRAVVSTVASTSPASGRKATAAAVLMPVAGTATFVVVPARFGVVLTSHGVSTPISAQGNQQAEGAFEVQHHGFTSASGTKKTETNLVTAVVSAPGLQSIANRFRALDPVLVGSGSTASGTKLTQGSLGPITHAQLASISAYKGAAGDFALTQTHTGAVAYAKGVQGSVVAAQFVSVTIIGGQGPQSDLVEVISISVPLEYVLSATAVLSRVEGVTGSIDTVTVLQ